MAAAVRSYAITPLQTRRHALSILQRRHQTAARIIEVVARVKYENFMQRRLFDPLGMKDTTFWPNEEQTRRIAKSYRPDAREN